MTPPSWYATNFAYGANTTADAVLKQGTLPTNYADKLLSKTTVTDPNANKSITFKDSKRRLVLSRRTDSAGTTNIANTFEPPELNRRFAQL